MIIVSRLNGESLGVNADLIERIEAMPDTVVTLVDGKKILVRETVDELIAKVLEYRASILRLAYSTTPPEPGRSVPPPPPGHRPAPLRLVHENADDRSEPR
jgi:flagellar protein FlbD